MDMGTILPLWLYARDKTWIRSRAGVITGEVELHVVSTGKTFYLAFASLQIKGDTGPLPGGSIIARDNVGGDEQIIISRNLETAVGAVGGEIAFPLPLPVPAGWSILVVSVGLPDVVGTIWGWEE